MFRLCDLYILKQENVGGQKGFQGGHFNAQLTSRKAKWILNKLSIKSTSENDSLYLIIPQLGVFIMCLSW